MDVIRIKSHVACEIKLLYHLREKHACICEKSFVQQLRSVERGMNHRHINSSKELSSAAIDDIIGRGAFPRLRLALSLNHERNEP